MLIKPLDLLTSLFNFPKYLSPDLRTNHSSSGPNSLSLKFESYGSIAEFYLDCLNCVVIFRLCCQFVSFFSIVTSSYVELWVMECQLLLKIWVVFELYCCWNFGLWLEIENALWLWCINELSCISRSVQFLTPEPSANGVEGNLDPNSQNRTIGSKEPRGSISKFRGASEQSKGHIEQFSSNFSKTRLFFSSKPTWNGPMLLLIKLFFGFQISSWRNIFQKSTF